MRVALVDSFRRMAVSDHWRDHNRRKRESVTDRSSQEYIAAIEGVFLLRPSALLSAPVFDAVV